MPSEVQTLKLSNGQKVPLVGLGTWKSKPDEVRNAVKIAIDCGYRHVDTAVCYENEHEIGEAIKEKIDSGEISRSEMFVTAKLWNTYHRREKVIECCQRSLKALGLEYIDLYLIHWPIAYKEGDEITPKNEAGERILTDVDYLETWQGMEECFEEGLVHSLGLSNFNHEQIQRVLDHCTNVKPVMLQVESHPYFNQNKLIEFCRNVGIELTAYCPLGSFDRPWKSADEPQLLQDKRLISLGQKYGKTPAQIALKFQVQRGVAVIPKSVTPSRIKENIELFDFNLSEEDMNYINNFGENYRFCHMNWLQHHRYYPFHLEY